MKLPFKGMLIGDESEVVSNPFSGNKVTLTPEAVAVYDTIMGAEYQGRHSMVKDGVDWFIKNYPSEYMVLLD